METTTVCILGLYRGYIRAMENDMETTVVFVFGGNGGESHGQKWIMTWTLGLWDLRGVYWGYIGV